MGLVIRGCKVALAPSLSKVPLILFHPGRSGSPERQGRVGVCGVCKVGAEGWLNS